MNTVNKEFLILERKEKFLLLPKTALSTLADLERNFNEGIESTDYENISNYFASISKEVIVSAEGVPLICLFFLLHMMMKKGSPSAKCVFYSALVKLERALKKDIYDAKEKGLLSKEAEENKKSLEAIRADVYRVHSCAKVFAFNLLSNNIAPDETVFNIVSKKQDYFDSQIEKFMVNPNFLEASLSDFYEYWRSDVEFDNCFSLKDSAAIFSSTNQQLGFLSFPSVEVKLPSAPVLPGELQFFLPDSHDRSVLFDSRP